MPTQQSLIDTFRKLHVKGDPVVLFNIWDAGSAKAVAAAGAKALATGSAPVAMAQGFADGEKIPLDLAIENVERILSSTELPLSMDLEGGYGADTATIEGTISRAMKTGIVGFNFEDQIVGGEGLYDIDTQSKRVAAARKASHLNGAAAFLNARTDIFLKAKPDVHTDAMIEEAIVRAQAYEQAGADGFFAPGLADEKFIATLCEKVNLPVNIIALPGVPENATLTKLGVARISYGPVPYRNMIKSLGEKAADAFS